MANPLIGTSSIPIDPEAPSQTEEIRQVLAETNASSKNSSTTQVEGIVPVTYRYLTFETELPELHFDSPIVGSTLEPPNLRQYDSPFTWSKARKSIVIWLSCMVTAFTAYTAGAYSSASTQMSQEFGVSMVAIYMGITTFTTGFGIAPMILAPFSEINGRKPVFVATGILFVVSQLCCAVTRSFPGMLVARFFVGVGGSTFSTMVGGVISDIYHTEDRNTPMALFSGAAFFGTGLGPLVSGFIAQKVLWRWIFWVQVIIDGLCILAVILFLNESRGSVLLSKKAQALNRWYNEREKAGSENSSGAYASKVEKEQKERLRWKVKSDEERESIIKMIGISLYRPFHLLLTEPVVFFFSLWISFSWAVLYLTFSSIPLVFTRNHHFNGAQNGAVFAAISIGAIISMLLSIYQEKVAVRYGIMSTAPEGRLYFACVESALLPLGLFMFGWTQFSNVPWIVPTLAIGLATMGIFSIYLAVFNYLADTYNRYASSALAAQSFSNIRGGRNVIAGAFPLINSAMFNRMTFSGASSFLGGVGLVLTLVPWVLLLYGPKIRARSKFASEIVN